MRKEKLRRVLQCAVIFVSAGLAAACILLAFLVESLPFEVFLPISSIALLAACTAVAIALSSTLLGLTIRWLKREG